MTGQWCRKLIGSLLRRSSDWNRGSLAIEFAAAAPVVIMLALGVADYSILMNTSASLRGATRAGAEYARANWNNPSVSDPTTGTEKQVCGFLGLSLAGGSCSPVTPGTSASCTCIDNTSVACPTATGSNPCAANSDPRVLVYVTVTATQSFTPLFSWSSFVFPSTLTESTLARTQ
jgi:Flp pilus assembly protein TadG